MSHRNCLIAAVLVWAAPLVVRAEDRLPTTAEVRSAAERALPYLEREGLAWIKARNCSSCHTSTFNLWAHQEARRKGLPVDEVKLAEWTAWVKGETRRRRDAFNLTKATLAALPQQGVAVAVRDKLLPLQDKSHPTEQEFVAAIEGLLSPDELAQHRAGLIAKATQKGDGGGLDNIHQLILGGAPFAGQTPDSEWLAELVTILSKWQQPSGSWKAAGQLPSTAEQNEITTAWTALALASLDTPGAETQQALAAAAPEMKKMQPGKTNESLLTLLLWERRFGAPDRAGKLQSELEQRQNSDGGWGWVPGTPSDAFATGQALYALSSCDLPAADATIGRGRRYLLSTQTDDGSWTVPPEKISYSTAPPRLKKLETIYRY